jgi:hypothetical protein
MRTFIFIFQGRKVERLINLSALPPEMRTDKCLSIVAYNVAKVTSRLLGEPVSFHPEGEPENIQTIG